MQTTGSIPVALDHIFDLAEGSVVACPVVNCIPRISQWSSQDFVETA